MRADADRSTRAGLVLFWIGAVWAIGWGIVGALVAGSVMNSYTPAELADSVWNVEGPLVITYGLSPAAGGLIAAVGMLLYSQAKPSTVWRVGLAVLFVLALAMVGMQGPYYPRLFGISGGLILLSFFGILWLWARERRALDGVSTAAADLRLTGYVFLLMGTWFACGIGAAPFLEALEGRDPTNPIHIIGLLAMGWSSLLASQYVASRQPSTETVRGSMERQPNGASPTLRVAGAEDEFVLNVP